MRNLRYILIVLLLSLLQQGCEKERASDGNSLKFLFSADSLTFNSSIGASGAVKLLKVINPDEEKLILKEIRLAGANKSPFKLNINGEITNELYDFEILPHDSIYIFVELKKDQVGVQSLIAEDSIYFTSGELERWVKLHALGNNFRFINSQHIKTSRWTNEMPYLVNNFAYIDSNEVLTIDAGTTIHFHENAGLFVKGTLIVNGSRFQPVVFKGDYQGNSSYEPSNQWNGIVIFSGSRNNKIDHAIIKNGNIGLQVGTIEQEGSAALELYNTWIDNMNWAGIWAMKSKIVAANCVISNVKNYNTALLLGGDYQFYQTTFANVSNGVNNVLRENETLVVSNYLVNNLNGVRYVGDMKQATFVNCIVAGSLKNELLVAMDKKGESNFYFDHCLIQVADSNRLIPADRFVNTVLNVLPGFVNPRQGIYELDSLSMARNVGKVQLVKQYPRDIRNTDRGSDALPDLGAYEWSSNKSGSK